MLSLLSSPQVIAERSDQFTWRKLPRTQSCIVPASPLSPGNISQVSVSRVAYNRTNQSLELQVGVVPSEETHGILERYEVVLRESFTDCLDCDDTQVRRFLVRMCFFSIFWLFICCCFLFVVCFCRVRALQLIYTPLWMSIHPGTAYY